MSDGISHGIRHTGTPTRGAIIRHFKGGRYIYIGRAMDAGNKEDTTKDKAVYMNIETGELWHRDYDEFKSLKVREDGTKVVRFGTVGYAKLEIDGRKGEVHVTHKL